MELDKKIKDRYMEIFQDDNFVLEIQYNDNTMLKCPRIIVVYSGDKVAEKEDIILKKLFQVEDEFPNTLLTFLVQSTYENKEQSTLIHKYDRVIEPDS